MVGIEMNERKKLCFRTQTLSLGATRFRWTPFLSIEIHISSARQTVYQNLDFSSS
ncbi:hypothetical protein VCSRO55_0819 [Vibrio cholerae]|nr:hypothetical protein A5A_023137 [Vibrio cholerae MZO-2]BCK26428.1 hypothetical protein VCSRO63_3372 [Vibrio cholerae]GHW12779.1 hypothetical protein VCSRO54_2389 [Vibrio cholerae]GHW20281.1 hypothetical protein VCSRO55_0819 [Vibrio cholerae]GHX64330.1 hypothetical protein VCSRO11_1486 [Vibrio cholerae]